MVKLQTFINIKKIFKRNDLNCTEINHGFYSTSNNISCRVTKRHYIRQNIYEQINIIGCDVEARFMYYNYQLNYP